MRRTLVAIVLVVAVILGWHLYGAADARRQVEEMRSKRGVSEHAAPVYVNPITNVVRVPIGPAKGKGDSDNPFEALGNALGSMFGGALAKALEPSIERELNLRARERYDVYAMILPYQVRVIAPDDGDDRTSDSSL